jgi:hypothetical protein
MRYGSSPICLDDLSGFQILTLAEAFLRATPIDAERILSGFGSLAGLDEGVRRPSRPPQEQFALFPTGLFEEMTADTARGLALRERRPTSVRQDWTISDLVGRVPAAAQPDTRTARTTRITPRLGNCRQTPPCWGDTLFRQFPPHLVTSVSIHSHGSPPS